LAALGALLALAPSVQALQGTTPAVVVELIPESLQHVRAQLGSTPRAVEEARQALARHALATGVMPRVGSTTLAAPAALQALRKFV